MTLDRLLEPVAADGWSASQANARPLGTSQTEVGNRLLQLMLPSDYQLLRPHLRRVPLKIGTDLAFAGEPIEAVWFLEGSVAGFLDVLGDGRRLTMGLVGREGCIGWPVLMGQDRWPYDVAVVAENSSVLRVDAARLLEAAERGSGIRDLLLRFAGSFAAQMGRTIVSNLIHCVEQRTARWILLYQDRVRSNDVVTITHEEMGFMLGVRRASITDALHALESDGAIRSLRGQIVIRDRSQLEALAAESYGFAEAEYQLLIGPLNS